MDRKLTLKSGMKFKHFKGGIYTILCVANHSETNEKLVIYQRDKDSSEYSERICARPINMFVSEVDKNKHPNVKQKYRFEVLDKENKLRYIDANELIKKLHSMKVNNDSNPDYAKGATDGVQLFASEIVENLPTADVKPVIHANWKYFNTCRDEDGWLYQEYKCTHCSFEISTYEEKYNLPDFCSKCGARMDGDI